MNRIFPISSVGNEIFDSEKYVLIIQKSALSNSQTMSGVVFGKRCIDKDNITGTTSEYYVHKLKTLTETNDYILDKRFIIIVPLVVCLIYFFNYFLCDTLINFAEIKK